MPRYPRPDYIPSAPFSSPVQDNEDGSRSFPIFQTHRQGGTVGFAPSAFSHPYPSGYGSPHDFGGYSGGPDAAEYSGGGAPMLSAPRLRSGNLGVPMLPQGLPTTSFHAPMIGGSHPGDFGVTGAMKVRSADYIRDSAPNMSAPQAITTQNGMSDQMLRQMWQNMKTTMPGADENTLVREFHNRAGKYGVNGGKWLEDQNKAGGGQVQTEYVNGQTITPSAPGVPLNMLGPDRAGGTMPPGFAASERGMAFGGHGERSAPIIGPKQGYTPVTETYTNSVLPQSRFTAADATRSRNMEADRMQIVGEGQMNAAPITGREAFQTGAQIANNAAMAPVAAAQVRAQGQVDAALAHGQATGRDPTVDAHKTRIATSKKNLDAALELWRADPSAENRALVDRYFNDVHQSQSDFEKYLPPTTQPRAQGGQQPPQVAPPPVNTYGAQPQQAQQQQGPQAGDTYVNKQTNQRIRFNGKSWDTIQ